VALPLSGLWVIGFGLALAGIYPSHRRVGGWNIGWAGFDVLFGVLIILTCWAAARRKWWTLAALGAVTGFGIADVWLSVSMIYDVGNDIFNFLWAFVLMPVYLAVLWRFVLRRVAPPRSGRDRGISSPPTSRRHSEKSASCTEGSMTVA